MKRKGFTLVELVVVIAIFGILVTVVTPAWISYLHRSKFRTMNQKSKSIFNAAQVVLTDLEFNERKYFAAYDAYEGTLTADEEKRRDKLLKYIYTPIDRSDWFFYWNGSEGYISDAEGNDISKEGESSDVVAFREEWNAKIGDSVKRIVDDDMVYKIWVSDYKVVSVACAENANSRFIGAHPTNVFELKGLDFDTDDLEHTNVRDVDLSWFDLATDTNGTLIVDEEEK